MTTLGPAAAPAQDHWARLAQDIRRMGPPQVPPASVVDSVAALIGDRGPVLLLGVTAAYADLGTARGIDLVAGDGNAAMITHLWPGDRAGRRALCFDWTAVPFADAHFGAVVGDGSLNALPSRAVLGAVLTEVRRVLAPGGVAVVRVFVRNDASPDVDAVLDAAQVNETANLNVLRWRIAGALASPPDFAVPVAAILAMAEHRLGPFGDYAARHAVPPEQAGHFENYRNSTAQYLFPTRDVFRDWAAQAGFAVRFVETAGYPGAVDCPLAVMVAQR